MTVKDSRGFTINVHEASDVLGITMDTFGEVKGMTVEYHGCDCNSKGGCLVILTRDLVNHVYPKGTYVSFI